MTLYLKYRPSDFDALVGQKFIKETLKQAIAQDKLVGAYLFCGPRGTGKTSTARIFAKSMNCLHPIEGEACGKCEICTGFMDGRLVDIIEIDAASYTGVDNIREIIEKAQFSPTQCRYKVYIIDEVHMLSKGAFNALLKILEEPPSHLKFILATTEIHKIPETILSRCQRYDFRSISKEDISEHLGFIAKNEGVEIDQASVNYIVKASNGALRNAISLFEQLTENGKILFSSIEEKLGIPKNEVLASFATKLLSGERSVIDDFETISYNYQIQIFLRELLFYFRDRLFEAFKAHQEVSQIVFILQTLDEAYLKMKNSFDAKTTLFVALVVCIDGKKEPVKVQNHVNIPPPVPTPKPQTTRENIVPPPSVEKEIDVQDALNVFGIDYEHTSPNPPVPQDTFPQAKFADLLKEKGAKGALTMAVRGAKFQKTSNEIHIFPANTIARKSFEGSEVQALLQQALAELGYSDQSIVVR